jgi:hypothetical protein
MIQNEKYKNLKDRKRDLKKINKAGRGGTTKEQLDSNCMPALPTRFVTVQCTVHLGCLLHVCFSLFAIVDSGGWQAGSLRGERKKGQSYFRRSTFLNRAAHR